MSTSVDPAKLPRADFERNNVLYKYTDTLREVKTGVDTKTHIEVEMINSTRNDIETILRLLPITKEITTEDGFFGILYLNTSTIKSEISGYGSTSSTVTTTRNYPNLHDRDSQYIPKSVTEGNITYMLSDIQWQTDNRFNVDDYEIGNRYTAVATYSGTKTSSFVRGYKITAEYSGEICRTGVSVVRYTVIFSGAKIETSEPVTIPALTEPETEAETEPGTDTAIEPEPTTEPGTETIEDPKKEKSSEFNWLAVVIPLALLAAAGIGGAVYLFLKQRKEQLNNEEETADYDYADGDYADDSSDAGDGDGV
jgi:hypothetical protein